MHLKAHMVAISCILLCSVLAITISGCEKKSATLCATGTVTLTWDAPKTNTDGTTLAPTDIKGYMIYYGASPGDYTLGNKFVPAPETSVTISIFNQGPGPYYFVITTVDMTGIESDFSNEVSKEVK